MSAETSIEWTDRTWNPVRGCDLVSPGCTNCYAMKQAHRFAGAGGPYEGLTKMGARGPLWTGEVRTIPAALSEPLSWRKPQRVFVNSMSDLFHPDVPFEFVAAVFGVMAACPQHTFQILTKRPERMREFFAWLERDRNPNRFRHPEIIEHAACVARDGGSEGGADRLFAAANENAGRDAWPLPNVWLGVSVEDQRRADDRIRHLLRTPAAVRFLSCEPLLGPVDLWGCEASPGDVYDALRGVRLHAGGVERVARIDWVIVGGESGPGARPFALEWARSLVRQCREASVAVFVKQLGAAASDPVNGVAGASLRVHPDALALVSQRLRDRKGGDPAEWPEDLRVREFPTAREDNR